MTAGSARDLPLETFERRLDAADLDALQRLVGLRVRSIAADHLDLRLDEGLAGARSLAFPLGGAAHDFVNVTSDWIQLPHDDVHLLRSAVTTTPWNIPVGEPNRNGARGTGPCSWLQIDAFGPISAIEIVSYEIEDDLLDAQGEAIAREAVLYDRALRFRFASGRVLTLSTHHNSILGEIEIRTDEGIGSCEPHGRASVRHTLH
ncbi:hypothetical protein [Enterovirga rhinocerotis]|uniref:Uncharacterized protein n=1 Tax=Enterovirga rhinocerotis TaxID=1339210 RepID=A0A4V3DXK6_9HYPH|nr:hypothetical protein [Enterovirga rhinocerotis]TDR89149.1 hypothetical protein EV668_3637 [Enterovirga rhinocerotis]